MGSGVVSYICKQAVFKDFCIKSRSEQEGLIRFKSGTKVRWSPSAIEQRVTNHRKRDGIESTLTNPTEEIFWETMFPRLQGP